MLLGMELIFLVFYSSADKNICEIERKKKLFIFNNFIKKNFEF